MTFALFFRSSHLQFPCTRWPPNGKRSHASARLSNIRRSQKDLTKQTPVCRWVHISVVNPGVSRWFAWLTYRQPARNAWLELAGWPGAFQPPAPTEPDMKLSPHPARAIQPTVVPQIASARTRPAPGGESDAGTNMLASGCWTAVCTCVLPNGLGARQGSVG